MVATVAVVSLMIVGLVSYQAVRTLSGDGCTVVTRTIPNGTVSVKTCD